MVATLLGHLHRWSAHCSENASHQGSPASSCTEEKVSKQRSLLPWKVVTQLEEVSFALKAPLLCDIVETKRKNERQREGEERERERERGRDRDRERE